MSDPRPTDVILSPDEMQAIAKVASFIYNLNNPGPSPILDFEGHFEWVYVRHREVVAEMNADFPELIDLKGPSNE